MKKSLLFLLTLSIAAPVCAQVVYSPVQQVQGTSAPNRGNAVNVLVTDGAGNASGTAASPTVVGGNVASGATDSGNPVKVGGVYTTTPPLLTTGQRGALQLNQYGSVRIQYSDNFGNLVAVTDSGVDGATNSVYGIDVSPHEFAYNGATWDRVRGNTTALSVLPGLSSSFWNYTSGATSILSNTTTAVTIKTAAGASVRNYLTACQLTTTAFGASVPLAIRDGAAGTVIWALTVPTAGFLQPVVIIFPVPLRGTANTLMEVVTTTANTSGTVTLSCQGFTGA